MPEEIDFFKSLVRKIDKQIPDSVLDYLVDGLQVRKLKKRQMFIDPSKVHNEVGFVAKGLMRGFYVNDEGEEITTRLINTGRFVTYYSAFLAQKPSDYYFQCLEESTVLCFTYEYVQAGYQQYPELQRFGRLVAESIIHILESRMRSFHFQSAQERYLDFIYQYPDLTNRVSLNHLSSYLGVKRPSLSRIRRNLTKNT